ncbi:MAG: AAA family ATPase, partial [Stellaceae bacterium]
MWQVLGESGLASRFEALHPAALTRLVGRDEEIDLLLRRRGRAKAGDGQIVLVCGEPGLGKSRITVALEERLAAEPHLRLRYFCSPYRQESALYLFIDQIGRAAGFAGDDTPAARLEKLRSLLAGTPSSGSGQTNWWRWRQSRVSPCGVRREPSFAGGSRPKMAVRRRGCRCCGAVWR